MRKYIFSSLLMLMMSIKAMACSGELPTYNYYMMQMYPVGYVFSTDFLDRANAFWKEYQEDKEDYFWFNMEEAKEAARKKNDQEILAYLELLGQYLDNCGEISNGWDYPTKEQLENQDQTMLSILKNAKAYTGSRLKSQYALLVMRANMQLERHADNKAYWELTASKLAATPYRDMMRNIYAGALLRLGQKREAWNIYAEQNDWESLRWSAFKFRNLAGIKSIYADDPNAAVLTYLVQDFVNSAQETLDQTLLAKSSEWLDDSEESIADAVNWTGANPVYQEEVKQFIAFADEVVRSKQSRVPCLWKTANALLHYLMGEYATAQQEIDEAMKLSGTERMKDNARCIRLLISTAQPTFNKKYSTYLLKEMQWLDGKIATVKNDSYYTYVKDRVMVHGLAKAYRQAGRADMALAIWGKLDKEHNLEFEAYEGWNNHYNGEYYRTLEQASPEEVVEYYAFLCNNPKDQFEQYVINGIYRDADYFNDLIGTKYLAQAQFEKAIPYLEKVPMAFMQQQNISWYLANRDYTKPRWMGKQKIGKGVQTEGPNLAVITTNKKLDFCRDMLQLSSQYLLSSNSQARKQLAYQQAVRYYQASYRGDCWFLTRYGNSCYTELYPWEVDFVEKARICLEECKRSDDFKLQEESLYALAFLPIDSWIDEWWTIGDPLSADQLQKDSRQYKALGELDAFARSHTSRISSYVSRCDVLRQFRKFN